MNDSHTPWPDGSWADPLSRKERAELARRLAKYALRFGAAAVSRKGRRLDGLHATTSEMQELRLDVTERAVVATS